MTSITHGNGTEFANILTNDKAEKRRFDKLAEQYPENVKAIASCPDGSKLYSVSWKWIILRKPATRTYTDEERARRVEWMREVGKSRKKYN